MKGRNTEGRMFFALNYLAPLAFLFTVAGGGFYFGWRARELRLQANYRRMVGIWEQGELARRSAVRV